jgi:hypothetical protein
MIKWAVILILAASAPAQAWQCKYDKRIDDVLEVSSSEVLEVAAAAGELRITGEPGIHEVRIRGDACASEEEWLDEISIETSSGRRASVSVVLPDSEGWSLWGSKYVYVDLELVVPEGLDLDVRDSSGDMKISNVAGLAVQDSSGEIEITDAAGPVEIRDSSGEIRIDRVAGDLTIVSDSSGGIRGTDIAGDVRVESDSSGDIRFTRVGRSVVVERDSSGDIDVESVEGDFIVMRDGSGSIHSKDVKGKVDTPNRD